MTYSQAVERVRRATKTFDRLTCIRIVRRELGLSFKSAVKMVDEIRENKSWYRKAAREAGGAQAARTSGDVQSLSIQPKN